MKIDLKFIQDAIERNTGLELTKNTRQRDYVFSRIIYYKLAREYTTLSLKKIGAPMKKNHATVLHALKSFNLIQMYEPALYEIYVKFKERYPVELFINKNSNIEFQESESERLFSINQDLTNKVDMYREEIAKLNAKLIDLSQLVEGAGKYKKFLLKISEIEEDQLDVAYERISAMSHMLKSRVV